MQVQVRVAETGRGPDEWLELITSDWPDGLSDPRQDIYTQDGVEPANAAH